MPTVFYAWQSDRDAAVCRHLIRKAAKQALKKLKTEPHVVSAPAFELDQDRQGIPGHPHIASAIRKKIKACDVFLADLTHVASYTAAGTGGKTRRKKTPNANVLIELGIAIRAKTFRRLVLVMNDHFGSPDDLPFDLKSHSFPITYTLADASDPQRVKIVRDKLADDIANALKPMLADIAAQMKEGEVVWGRDRTTEQTNDFYARFNAGDFHRLKEENIPVKVIDGSSRPDPREAFLLLSIVPLKAPNPPLDIAAVEQQRPSIFKPLDATGWSPEGYGSRIVLHDAARSGPRAGIEQPTSVVELNDDGCIFAGKRMLVWPSRIEGKDVVNLEMFERPMLWQLTYYVKVLRDLKVTGAIEVRLILHGLADAYISNVDPHRYDRQRIRTVRDGTVKSKPVTLSAKIDGNSVSEVAAAMRASLAMIWRDAGYPGDPCFDHSHKFLADSPC